MSFEKNDEDACGLLKKTRIQSSKMFCPETY